MESWRTRVQPAGAVKAGSSSLMTIEASITWPAAVPAGRSMEMFTRADADPSEAEASAVPSAASAVMDVWPAANRPTASARVRRARRGYRVDSHIRYLAGRSNP